MTCAALGANPPVQEILSCGLLLGIGDMVLVGILVFVVFLYGLYRMKAPFIISLPTAFLMSFVFSGAGNRMLAIGGGVGNTFTILISLFVLVMAPILILAFWRFRK